MAITRPDEYVHQNQDLAIADSRNVRGGRRAAADRAALYALASKSDQLAENVTIVRILSDGENGGGVNEVVLVDAANIGNSAGWQLYSAGAAAPGGGGSPVGSGEYRITLGADGPQTIALPAGALGLDGQPSWYQADTGLGDTLGNYAFSGGSIEILAGSPVKAGDQIYGRYTYGGTGGAGGDPGTGDIDASRIKGVLAEENFPALTPAKVSQLTDVVNQENAQRGPLVLVAQPLLDTPQDGALEFNGVGLFFTTGGVRSQLN